MDIGLPRERTSHRDEAIDFSRPQEVLVDDEDSLNRHFERYSLFFNEALSFEEGATHLSTNLIDEVRVVRLNIDEFEPPVEEGNRNPDVLILGRDVTRSLP